MLFVKLYATVLPWQKEADVGLVINGFGFTVINADTVAPAHP